MGNLMNTNRLCFILLPDNDEPISLFLRYSPFTATSLCTEETVRTNHTKQKSNQTSLVFIIKKVVLVTNNIIIPGFNKNKLDTIGNISKGI